MTRFVQEKEVLAELAGLARALRAASRDRELSVWLREESAFLPAVAAAAACERVGRKKRGVKEEPPPEPERPAAGGAARRAPEVQRQSGAAAAPAPRRSYPPAESRAQESRGTREAQPGTPRLRRWPARALCGSLAPRAPTTPGVAWVFCPSSTGLLFPASPNLLRAANSIKIKHRGRFKKKSKQRQKYSLKNNEPPRKGNV